MSFLIQFLKTRTPGELFPDCNPEERREIFFFFSVAALEHTHSLSACWECVWASESRAAQHWECILCMKLRECNSCSKAGGSFPPCLRLLTSFKSLNFSLLLTSPHQTSPWSLWETSSLSLLPPPIYLFHLLMTASFHSYSTLSLRRLSGRHIEWPGALFNSSSAQEQRKRFGAKSGCNFCTNVSVYGEPKLTKVKHEQVIKLKKVK